MVSETWPPEVNGVAATAARVVQALRARGHAVDLVRPRQDGDRGPGDDQLALMRGLPLPRYPGLRMGLPARGALISRWRRNPPDVVHLVTEGPLGWSALAAARHLALPAVSDYRTNFQSYSAHYGLPWLARPVQAMLRSFHNRCACTMVPTEALRRELAGAGFQRLRVVARGVDAQLFHPARRSPVLRASWGAGPDTPVVLCVGRLAPEKNLGAVLDAAAALRAVRPDARLVLVGDGPERTRLAQRAPEAFFAGQRHGEDLAAHYASADVFLFPSLTETFGNVVPEAMASGLAVLAYDLAAAGQLIAHGDNGMLAPPGDAAAFCRGAAVLGCDAARVRALGQRARASAGLLDWERIALAVEGEYRTAIAAADGRQPAGCRTAIPAG